MSSPGQVAGATSNAAGETASTAKDQATQVGSTAASAASDVAGTTKEQAGAVAGEAVSQVRGLLDQTREQVTQQAGGAQQKLGESVRSISDELRSMGDGSGSGSGPAAELVRSLAERGSVLADALSDKQPAELLQELRSFAARRPGAFLLGALAAGVAAGRLTRGVKDGSSSSTSVSSVSSAPRTPALPAVATTTPVAPAPIVDPTVVAPALDDTVGLDVYPVDPEAGAGLGRTGTGSGLAEDALVDPGAVRSPYGTGPGL